MSEEIKTMLVIAISVAVALPPIIFLNQKFMGREQIKMDKIIKMELNKYNMV